MAEDLDTLEVLKDKATKLFFPNDRNYFNEEISECDIYMTQASDIHVDENMLLQEYLVKNGIYISKTYFVIHTSVKNQPFGYVPLPESTGVCQKCNHDTFDNTCYICFVAEQSEGTNSLVSSTVSNAPHSASGRRSSRISVSGQSSRISVSGQSVGSSHVPGLLTTSPPDAKQLSNSTSVSSQIIESPNVVSMINKVMPSVSILPTTPLSNPNRSISVSITSSTISSVSQSSATPLLSTLLSTPPSVPVSSKINDDCISIRSEDSESSRADTVPYVTPEHPLQATRKNRVVRINRMKIKDDMINAFKTIDDSDNILYEVIDPCGQREEGIGVGVERDLYSSFWLEIADSLCVGATERVPFVRHDLYIEEWEAIGKILRRGYVDVKYFPIQLSQAFVIVCFKRYSIVSI